MQENFTEELSGLLPPQDLEAERSVLGSCMLMPEVIDDVLLITKPDHFYVEAHRIIAEALADLWNSGTKAMDAVVVANELTKRGKLQDVGGPSYLVKILETVPHAAHAEYYAKIVYEKWVRRSLVDASDAMRAACYDPTLEFDEVTAKADQAVKDALEQTAGQRPTDINQLMMEALFDKGADAGAALPTGLADLDELCGGMFSGQVIVIGARPSMGKTGLATRIALNVAQSGRHSLLVSLEQPRLEIADRLLAMEAQVDVHAMRKGDLTSEDREQLIAAGDRLSSCGLAIADPNDINVTRIGSMARIARRRRGLDLLVIDYMQLIEPDDRRDVREQQVARMSRSLKIMAKELGIPVVVLIQLNRQVESRDVKAPRMSDARESGSLEQDADQMWLLWRPDYYDPTDRPGEAELIVAKNRSGPVGKIKLVFRKEFVRFDSMARTSATDGEWSSTEDEVRRRDEAYSSRRKDLF